MFFYDNLASGAGYSSLIGSILNEVLEKAKANPFGMQCSRACKNCLDNFIIKESSIFDRYLG